MRYPQGGGLTAERRAFREHPDADGRVIRPGTRHCRHRQAVTCQRAVGTAVVPGMEARRNTAPGVEGAGVQVQLSEALFEMLEQELARGPVARGWPDQTWTLARIETLIGRRFHKSMTLSAIAQTLHRHGFSHQVPARRAIERDEEAVTGWVKETWPRWERRGGARGLALLRRRSRLLDDAAHSPHLVPARTHTRHTGPQTLPAPLLHRRSGLLQAARTLTPDLPAQTARRPQQGGRRSFTWTDYRDLLITAHQQLGAPIVLVWDNLNVHRDRRLREFKAGQAQANSANRQPSPGHSTGAGRARRHTTEGVADLPQARCNPNRNAVNRRGSPYPGAAGLKRLSRYIRSLPRAITSSHGGLNFPLKP